MPRKRKATRRKTRFQKCIGLKLKGRKFGSRAKVRAAFKKAVAACKRG